jgi:pantoate--beta-alanine ligase
LIVAKSVKEYPVNHSIRTGFVPTMGALHEGHLSLIRHAATENDRVVVSIFVNPTQFGPQEDFHKYPRPFERDCELAVGAGAQIIFSPTVEEMYPSNPSLIHIPVVTDTFEGAHRPGHFDGVATIVSKLFNIVNPTKAYFGMKDLQQCAVIRKLVNDLNHRVEVDFRDTLRESNGLAMSSRNAYLSPSDRAIAPKIYQILCQSKSDLLRGFEPKSVLESALASLNDFGFSVDYFELVNWSDMQPTETISDDSFLVVAARLGKTRLIDNLKIIG